MLTDTDEPQENALTSLPRRAAVGDIEFWSLSDGSFFPTLNYFGPDVASSDKAGLFAPGQELHDLPMGAFLLRVAPDRVILVDGGLGVDPEGEKTAGWEALLSLSGGDLPRQIEATGVTALDVTDIVITHFHADHCGWLLDQDKAEVFTRARVWVGGRDLTHFRDVAEGVLRIDEHMRGLFEQLDREGRLHQVDDAVICEGVTIHATPGHTPGHIVVAASSQGQTLWMLGDAMTIPHQLEESAWHSCGDLDPELAQQTRERLWDELEKPHTWGVGSHFPHLIPGSVLAAEGRRWIPATSADSIAARPTATT